MVTVGVLGALRVEVSDREHFGFEIAVDGIDFGVGAA
jgi:hypothetical protein